MMPTIFVTKNPQKTLEILQKKLVADGVKPVNIHMFETEGSIGIAEVKALQTESSIASTGGQKVIIMPHADELTLPAQNALLKLLEEPPEHLSLFLFVTQQDALLPTIQSRCQIIIEDHETEPTPEKMMADVQEFLQTIQTATLGERLAWAQKITKEKSDTLLFVETAIRELHKALITSPTAENALLLDQLLSLRTIVATTNVNARLAAEDSLLQMQQ